MPFSAVNAEHEYEGVGAEIVLNAERYFSVKSFLLEGNSWDEKYNAVVEGDIDFLPMVSISKERLGQVIFTHPVTSFPLAVFSRVNSPKYNGLSSMKGVKLGVVEKSVLADRLKVDYPDIKLIYLKNTLDMISALNDGDVEAIVDNPSIIRANAKLLNHHQIKLNTSTEYMYEMAFAVNKRLPELALLFNVVISEFSEREKVLLVEKWINFKVVKEMDWSGVVWVFVVFLVFFLLVLLVFLWQGKSLVLKKTRIIIDRLNRAQKISKTGSWDINSCGEYSNLSLQAASILGVSSSATLSFSDYLSFIKSEYQDNYIKAWERAKKSGLIAVEYKVAVGGEDRWIFESGELSFDAKSSVVGGSGTIRDITEQKKYISEIGKMNRKMVSIQEGERKKVARELHDDICQNIAGQSIILHDIINGIDDERGKVELLKLGRNLNSLSKDIHGLSRRLHPSILNDLGLVDAIKSELALYKDKVEIVSMFNVGNIDAGSNVNLCVFRVVQESLRNASKYSGATSMFVSLVYENNRLALEVEDNGVGFDVAKHRKKPGLGLIAMQERVFGVGGEFSISSEEGVGTSISAEIPVRA